MTARKEHLSQIVQSQLTTPSEQMAAIHLLNKMEAVYVTKIEADVSHEGGVMLVPMAASVDDWTAVAESSQAKLMNDAIDGVA